jgi:hypothetical protein
MIPTGYAGYLMLWLVVAAIESERTIPLLYVIFCAIVGGWEAVEVGFYYWIAARLVFFAMDFLFYRTNWRLRDV